MGEHKLHNGREIQTHCAQMIELPKLVDGMHIVNLPRNADIVDFGMQVTQSSLIIGEKRGAMATPAILIWANPRNQLERRRFVIVQNEEEVEGITRYHRNLTLPTGQTLHLVELL